MAGLPRKDTITKSELVYENGLPKDGTIAKDYLIASTKKAYNKGYCDGVVFTVNDIAERLKHLVYMDFDDYTNLSIEKPLPEYAQRLTNLLNCIKEFSIIMESQINNLNRNSIKDKVWQTILRNEHILGEARGSILNPKIRMNKSKITENRGNKPGNPLGAGRKQTKPKKEKKIKPEDLEPTDLLINENLGNE